MELESQVMADNSIVFPDTVFYDILAQANYPLIHYKSPENDDLNMVNNNISKSDLAINNLDILNKNLEHMVKFPISIMPPPPQKVNYNNNVVKRYHPREGSKPRDNYRPISPKGYDSDESCTSYSSSTTAHFDNGYYFLDSLEGAGYNSSRCGMNKLGDQTLTFGKYSHSTPTIYHSNIQYTPSNQQVHNNGHYNKNRYYTNNNNNNNNNGTTNNHHGRHKYSNQHRGNMDIILRRAHGLVERFKSRAELMRIDPQPPGLLLGGPWDQLNQAIWDVFSSKAQKEKTYESKIILWKNIFLYIRKCLNNYGLFMVGSTMSGFGLESSDIDMCLLTKPCTNDPRLDSLHHLNAIRHLLVRCGLTVDSELILAKVPILKFKDKETGFEIDLNCNNSVGIRNTHLMHSYSRLDWRVRPLVVMVKLWAQANNINDAKNMTVSSYSWALMVVHFLQCGISPPVLPCLHGLAPEKFSPENETHSMDVQEEIASIKNFTSENTACLGELLTGFFHYFANFNYGQYAISVRTGGMLPVDECRFQKAPKNDPHQWKYLCIEEPFDLTNTARSVFDLDTFKHIKNIIARSYEELACKRMLNNILPVSLDNDQS